MKKLIFGLVTFFVSVLGIIGSIGTEMLGRYIFAFSGCYPTGALETTGACLFAFVITAALGFLVALIGAFTRDNSK